MEPCRQEKVIAKLDKAVFGNGRKGLLLEFEHYKTEHGEMKDDLGRLATSFSALAQLDGNREAVRKAVGKGLKQASLIIGSSSVIITLLIKLL